MITGIAAGILTIIFQPLAYLFSRVYTMRGGPVLELLVYSHIIMGVFSLAVMLFFLPGFDFNSAVCLRLTGCVLTFLAGQGCYFMTVKLMEPSRLTTLLGQKLIFLVLLNMIFFNASVGFAHWIAVILCVAAAFVMNQSGGRISLKALFAVMLSCLFLAGSDIMDMLLVKAMPYQDIIQSGIAATALCYSALGLVVLPAFFFIKFDHKKAVLAIPYSISWLLAMVTLFICFGILGTVFANILQSGRALVQVILGSCVAYFGFASIEPKALKRQWLCRLTAAVMITAAVAVYVLSGDPVH
ncbi:EamA family transporter [Lentisphaerota bacterium ZTH]|nr:EamA family transporter [Lentisphaerota bacterium]WET07265.1 EamA family transporter [Lentisphaerota bacterium ZTH]